MLIFDPHTDIATTRDGVVVNTVNTVGVMGAGVARAVRTRFCGCRPRCKEEVEQLSR